MFGFIKNRKLACEMLSLSKEEYKEKKEAI